jgi:tetrahydromethanopterin S-methyltransferase subunit B
MKRLAILALVYIIGGVSGVIFHSVTSGAEDRARITVLESDLKSRNDKLDKCTDALINGLHPSAPQTAVPAAATSSK